MNVEETTLKHVLCFFGKHSYVYLGKDHRDEVFRCACCGVRMVKPYTLRVDRLGGNTPALAGFTSVRRRSSRALKPHS